MSIRADLLAKFGLRDRAAFEIEPCQDPHDMWRVKFAYEGDPAELASIGHAAKLAVAIRSVDPDLAEQIESCIETARRYAQDSGGS